MVKVFSTKRTNDENVLNTGKYKGLLISRVPLRYLFNQFNNGTELAVACKKEIDRRGVVPVNVDISSHAIDRASLNLLDMWKSTHKRNEGLYSWLGRMAEQSLAKGIRDDKDTVAYKRMLFVFDYTTIVPVLKTVMLNPKKV